MLYVNKLSNLVGVFYGWPISVDTICGLWFNILTPNLSKHARKYFQKIFDFFFLLKSKNQFSKNCFRFYFFEKFFENFFLKKIFENYFEIFFEFFVDNFFDGIFDKILDKIFEKFFEIFIQNFFETMVVDIIWVL